MAWFGKKRSSPDVLDLTKMQKDGLLQRSQEAALRQAADSNSGVIDFTKSQSFSSGSSSNASTASSSSSDPAPSALGFLSNLASSGGGNTASTSSYGSNEGTHMEDASYGSYTDKLKAARTSKLAEFNSMKIKLEDSEFKLNNAIQRIDMLEKKLAELQNSGF